MKQIKILIVLSLFYLSFTSICFSKTKEIKNYKYKVIKLTNLKYPWGLDLVNNDTIIITEKEGHLSVFDLNKNTKSFTYTFKDVLNYRQGGLLDTLHLTFKGSQYIFSCYQDKKYDLVISRHQLSKNKLIKKKIFFKSNYKSRNGLHFGCRMIYLNESIYITLGDRGKRENSQNPNNFPGSILRLPLNETTNKQINFWRPNIFSIGHRNPQGLIFIEKFNEIWSHEHGPKGGDEINIIKKGKNYGWPIITYGKEYWGGPIGQTGPKEGYEEPIWKWIPSIAPSGIAFYDNDYFKKLRGSILIGSLKFKSLYILKLKNKRPISEDSILKNKIGRIRDVLVHPKGYILIINDEIQGGLYKMVKN